MATMTAVINPHIQLDESGRAWITDTSAKVIEIAEYSRVYGPDAARIHEALPHISLAKIHAALSYYFDHQQAFDNEIAEGDEEYERLWAEQQAQPDPIREKIRRYLDENR